VLKTTSERENFGNRRWEKERKRLKFAGAPKPETHRSDKFLGRRRRGGGKWDGERKGGVSRSGWKREEVELGETVFLCELWAERVGQVGGGEHNGGGEKDGERIRQVP